MEKLVWISLGGLLGAWSRYYLGLWAVEKWGNSFAVGVLAINIIGSLIMAWAMVAGGERNMIGPSARLFLTVGFCACFTTFSTFSWDTYRYFSEGNFKLALLNVFLNVGCCLMGTWGGVVLARAF